MSIPSSGSGLAPSPAPSLVPNPNPAIERVRQVGAVLAAISALTISGAHYFFSGQVRQLAILGVVVGCALCCRAGAVWVLKAGVSRYAFTFLAMGAMYYAPVYFGDERTSFPLVRWSMYSTGRESDDVIIYRLKGTLQNGQRVDVNVNQLFPGADGGTRRLGVTLSNMLKASAGRVKWGWKDEAAEELLTTYLGAIAAAYERRTGGPLKNIEIERGVYPLREGKAEITFERVSLPGAQWEKSKP